MFSTLRNMSKNPSHWNESYMICMRSKLLKANLLGRYIGNFCNLRAQTEDAPMILSGVFIIHTCWGVSNKLGIFLTHLHSWINHISKLPHMTAWLDKRGCGEHVTARRWQWCASRRLWNETDVDANDALMTRRCGPGQVCNRETHTVCGGPVYGCVGRVQL